ncbi:MAG: NADH-dependent alcohol dehydrogenase, partial [Pseudoalteromonas tetraodonis]
HGDDKAAAIDNIIAKLEAHGMLALGENQAITLKESREILEQAVA